MTLQIFNKNSNGDYVVTNHQKNQQHTENYDNKRHEDIDTLIKPQTTHATNIYMAL